MMNSLTAAAPGTTAVSFLRKLMIVALMGGALALAGCGGGWGSSPSDEAPPVVQPQDPAAPGDDDPLAPEPGDGDEKPDPGQPGGEDEIPDPGQPGGGDETPDPGQPGGEDETPDPGQSGGEDETPDPGQPGDDDPVVPPVEDPDPPEQPSDPEDPEEPAPGDDDPVVTPPDRDVSLSWRAPTERENGEALPLAQLYGYRIYYGPLNNPTAFRVDVNDASLTSYTLEDLDAGTYRFAVSAIDTNGLESALSNTMTKVVD
ncbi:MAG: hypothetical protein AB7U81_02255 [Thiohalomonadaceae bacterium]